MKAYGKRVDIESMSLYCDGGIQIWQVFIKYSLSDYVWWAKQELDKLLVFN